jgi:hypothetical protein
MMTIKKKQRNPQQSLLFFHELKLFGHTISVQAYHIAMKACLSLRSHRLLRVLYTEMRDAGIPVSANICATIIASIVSSSSPNWYAESMRIYWGTIEIEGICPTERCVKSVLRTNALRDEEAALRIFYRDFYSFEQYHRCYGIIINMYAKKLNLEEYVEMFNVAGRFDGRKNVMLIANLNHHSEV